MLFGEIRRGGNVASRVVVVVVVVPRLTSFSAVLVLACASVSTMLGTEKNAHRPQG